MALDQMYYSIRSNGKLVFSACLTYQDFHTTLSYYLKNYENVEYCVFDCEEDFKKDLE